MAGEGRMIDLEKYKALAIKFAIEKINDSKIDCSYDKEIEMVEIEIKFSAKLGIDFLDDFELIQATKSL